MDSKPSETSDRSKQPTTLYCTIIHQIQVQCESIPHAEAAALSLRRWGEEELHRIEPMIHSTEYRFTVYPLEGSEYEIGELDSRVNP